MKFWFTVMYWIGRLIIVMLCLIWCCWDPWYHYTYTRRRKIEHFSWLKYQLCRKIKRLLSKSRVLNQLKYTHKVSLCIRLVWMRLTERVCPKDLTIIDNLSKAIYGKYYRWYNLVPIRSLLSLHKNEKNKIQNPDAKTNFTKGIFL